MIGSLFYILTSSIGIISSSLGIGGGCLLLSLFTHYTKNFDWLENKYIAPLVTTTVLSNNLVRSCFYINKKHNIHQNYSIIDYSVLTVMAPFDTLGSYLGIKVNEYLNYKQINCITLLLFFAIFIKLILKLIRKNKTNNIYNIPLVYDKKLNFIPQIISYIFILVFGLFEYYYVSIVGCLFLGMFSIKYNLLNQSSVNLVWSRRNSLIISVGSLCIGFLSTLVGIGGSMISTPMLLSMNFKPNVIISTNSLSGLFSTISSTIQYFNKDRVLLNHSLTLFNINLISCVFGTVLSLKLQKGNEKIYTFLLLTLVSVCMYLYILRFF